MTQLLPPAVDSLAGTSVDSSPRSLGTSHMHGMCDVRSLSVVHGAQREGYVRDTAGIRVIIPHVMAKLIIPKHNRILFWHHAMQYAYRYLFFQKL